MGFRALKLRAWVACWFGGFCCLQGPLRPSPAAVPLLSLTGVPLNAPSPRGGGLDVASSRARMGGWEGRSGGLRPGEAKGAEKAGSGGGGGAGMCVLLQGEAAVEELCLGQRQ